MLLSVCMLAQAFKIELVSAVIIPPKFSVYVDPPLVEGIMPSNSFTISIKTDYNESDLVGWQFTLSYDARVLHGVNVTNGDLLNEDKYPHVSFIPGNFDNTAGTLSLTAAIFFFINPPPPTATGPGTLANVTFMVVGYGTSNITLGSETKLIGYYEGEPFPPSPEPQYEIPVKLRHGYFTNVLPGDADLDGDVDSDDVFTYVAPAYGSKIGDPNYNPNCDFDRDGNVDSDDVFTYLAPNYGKTA